jgi:hypothetical protein
VSAEVLREAARLLEELLGPSRESWKVDIQGKHVYVAFDDPDEEGNWIAYAGDEAGARVYARWIATMDPLVGRLLVDVLEGCADSGNLDDDLVAFAEMLIAKARNSGLE